MTQQFLVKHSDKYPSQLNCYGMNHVFQTHIKRAASIDKINHTFDFTKATLKLENQPFLSLGHIFKIQNFFKCALPF